MRILVYLSLLLLLACSDEQAKAMKAAEDAKIAEAARVAETSKQTKLMLEEVDVLFNTTKTENMAGKKAEEVFQQGYLKLDILPEKYPQADPEAVTVVKEARVFFEFIYDVVKEYSSSSGLFIKLISYSVNTLARTGKTLPEAIKELDGKQKELAEKTNKLQFHFDQLEIKMCSKYQIRCKVKS